MPRLLSISLLVSILLFAGCNNRQQDKLPVISEASQPFRLYNQNNELITETVFTDKLVVADFFFTTCPSICPIMKRQMYRVYEHYKNNPEVLLFSHTVDPNHDTVEVLNNYAKGLGIVSDHWQMVTGPQQEIFDLAKHYGLGVLKNDEAPGGYIHSGSFILIDKNRKIRGYYNGTMTDEVDQLINDIKRLLDEQG